MRTLQGAVEAVEAYSPAEEQFNRRRRTVGLVVAPLVFVTLLAVPMPGMSWQAHRMAAVMALVIVLWVTEALPMAVVALLGPILAILLQVAKPKAALASFADPIIFLFIGSFMLAEAMFVHGVDRRIAYTALSQPFIGRSGARVMIVYGGVAAVLSMWISNTATTAMMFPIGLALIAHVARNRVGKARRRAAVRDGDDADHLVRGVGRRPGDPCRHAAEPDRDRAHRAHPRRAHRLLQVDGHRRAAGDRAVRLHRRLLLVDVGAPRGCRRGQCAARPRRTDASSVASRWGSATCWWRSA